MRSAFGILLIFWATGTATAETLLDQQSEWKFSPTLVEGWEQPDFDDSGWLSGVAPFTDTPGGCSLLGEEGYTFWEINTTIYLRTTFQGNGVQVAFRTAIDNELTLYLNGTFVGTVGNSGCTQYWEDSITLPEDLVVEGTNTLAVRAVDVGNFTYFDAMVETFDALLIPVSNGAPISGSRGIGWVDVNGDSHDDVVIVVDGGENHFYANDTDGTFTEILTGDLVTGSFASVAVSGADYDNDGWMDVFVANRSSQRDRLFRGNGTYDLNEVTGQHPAVLERTSLGCAWADYDEDGFVDLFVAVESGNNLLYRNNADGTFTQITTGSVVTDGGVSRACSWIDYDLDGDPDLYVYNNGNNFLYRNDAGELVRVTGLPITDDVQNSMGGSWGDYDNDRDPDLFVSNHDSPNQLYENLGDGNFVEHPGSGVTPEAQESRGSSWADYDNDGDLDLVLMNRGSNERDVLFENAEAGRFNVKYSDPIANGTLPSFGSAWCDVENDGDLDLLVSKDSDNGFFLNSGNDNGWIEIALIGTVSNRSAIGARIDLRTELGWQTREIASQNGGYTQSSLTAHFGAGTASIVDTLIVTWPSGIVWDTTGVALGQRLVLIEEEPTSGVAAEGPIATRQSRNEPNPFHSHTSIRYRLEAPSTVSIRIVDIAGREIRRLGSAQIEPAGDHQIVWDGRDGRGEEVASGVYFYTLRACASEVIGRMDLIR